MNGIEIHGGFCFNVFALPFAISIGDEETGNMTYELHILCFYVAIEIHEE